MRNLLLPLVCLLATSRAITLDSCNVDKQYGRSMYQCPGCQVHLDEENHVTLLQGSACENYEIPAKDYADHAVVQLPGCQRNIRHGEMDEQGAACRKYAARPWRKLRNTKVRKLNKSKNNMKPLKKTKNKKGLSKNSQAWNYAGQSSFQQSVSGSGGSYSSGSSCRSVTSSSGNKIVECNGCQQIFDRYGNLITQKGSGCDSKKGGSKLAKSKGRKSRKGRKSKSSKSRKVTTKKYNKAGQLQKCTQVTSPQGIKVESCKTVDDEEASSKSGSKKKLGKASTKAQKKKDKLDGDDDDDDDEEEESEKSDGEDSDKSDDDDGKDKDDKDDKDDEEKDEDEDEDEKDDEDDEDSKDSKKSTKKSKKGSKGNSKAKSLRLRLRDFFTW